MNQLFAGRKTAYFSMEIGIDTRLPTYSGGLGVLAGDTLKSFADLGLPVVAVSLVYHKGYFRQSIGADGKQVESSVEWQPATQLEKLPNTITMTLEGRSLRIEAWLYRLVGVSGATVPVIFLDASAAANDSYHRTLTDQLYGGDERYRLCQEALLGIGGVQMLAALGCKPGTNGLTTYHMNEGHSALLTLGLMEQLPNGRSNLDQVRSLCMFTTHTPVPAGHDTFSEELTTQCLGAAATADLKRFEAFHDGRLNMSHLALRFSRFTNGVAKRHAEVSRAMFPGVEIAAITNGIHAATWTADSMRNLFDRYIPDWRHNNFSLRYACELPIPELRAARLAAKKALFAEIQKRTGVELQPEVFTIGFARRAAEYKRGDLMFRNPAELARIARAHGGLQIVFAGKAHPKDMGGKAVIASVCRSAAALAAQGVRVIVLENYDMDLGRLITTGTDLWLNNPLKPLEASGTSGMKAALNGVPNLSTLDGWWIEGHIEGVTGWEIEDRADAYATGDHHASTSARPSEQLLDEAAANLYRKLDTKILPLYRHEPDAWAHIMRYSIAWNGAHFNTHRMVCEYALRYRIH